MLEFSEILGKLGRPIPYYPKISKALGNEVAALFILNFVYWRGKGRDPSGWIYKTQPEIEEETGLHQEQTGDRS